jgi:hypothetical protein
MYSRISRKFDHELVVTFEVFTTIKIWKKILVVCFEAMPRTHLQKLRETWKLETSVTIAASLSKI